MAYLWPEVTLTSGHCFATKGVFARPRNERCKSAGGYIQPRERERGRGAETPLMLSFHRCMNTCACWWHRLKPVPPLTTSLFSLTWYQEVNCHEPMIALTPGDEASSLSGVVRKSSRYAVPLLITEIAPVEIGVPSVLLLW